MNHTQIFGNLNQMMNLIQTINKKVVIGVTIILIATAVTLILNKPAYKVELFKVDNGWGYEIELAGETYIHQPFIPSIQSIKPFPSKKLAKKTAYLVIKKLKHGELPTLTIEDINNLGLLNEDR